MITCKFIPQNEPQQGNTTIERAKFLITYNPRNENDQKAFKRLEKFVDVDQEKYRISLVKSGEEFVLTCHNERHVEKIQEKLIEIGIMQQSVVAAS